MSKHIPTDHEKVRRELDTTDFTPATIEVLVNGASAYRMEVSLNLIRNLYRYRGIDPSAEIFDYFKTEIIRNGPHRIQSCIQRTISSPAR
jgi:hypothetical protein